MYTCALTVSAVSETLNTKLVSLNRRFSDGMKPSRNILIPSESDRRRMGKRRGKKK